MRARWIMGIGGLVFLLLIAVGTAVGVATAGSSKGEPAAISPLQTTAQQQQQGQPWLGIVAVQTPNGVTVSAVVADSPSDTAGLKRGDIIKAVDGTAVNNLKDLHQQLGGKAVGNTVNLSIARGDQTMSIAVTLAARPAPLVQLPNPFPELAGIPKDQLPSHVQGGQFNVTDANGNPIAIMLNVGTVASKTDNSLTVNLNSGGQKTFQVSDNTLGHALLSKLQAGAHVTVVTVGTGTDARVIAPGADILPRGGRILMHDRGMRHERHPDMAQ